MTKKKIKIEFIDTFHGLDFPLSQFRHFIQKISQHEKIPVGSLRIIAVDDEYLRSLHRQYVRDDSYTDVMVFPLDDQVDKEAEIYISGKRAKANAKRYRVTLKKEIARLICHALLHLQGFDDSAQAARKKMHALENQLLRKYWKSTE
ncbi:MAG: rRNA maturation RNase YbeY [Caldithrix sp. RBG_13_44_9]|nr:MAG: rRNA maturation RNase YbeY [Caldithrix sp. RBG_13_44_9]